jgi:hypothetical protein
VYRQVNCGEDTVVEITVFQAVAADAIPDLGDAANAVGMSGVERAQYKAYKELKQRIERERQLAVVQVAFS